MAGKGASVRIVGATAFASISKTEACAKSAEAAAFASITGRKACARLVGAAGFVCMAGAEVSARLAGAAAFAGMAGEEADARIVSTKNYLTICWHGRRRSRCKDCVNQKLPNLSSPPRVINPPPAAPDCRRSPTRDSPPRATFSFPCPSSPNPDLTYSSSISSSPAAGSSSQTVRLWGPRHLSAPLRVLFG
jgi:hypothetical protein